MRGFALLMAVLSALSVCDAASPIPGDQPASAAEAGMYLKVQLDAPLKTSKLKAGDVVAGNLARTLYSSGHELFPGGSRVQLTVDHMDNRRRLRNDHWPWIVRAFTPRHESYPVFENATISGAGGEGTLHVKLLSISRKREVHARGKNREAGAREGSAVETAYFNKTVNSYPTMVFEAFDVNQLSPSSSAAGISAIQALPAGTELKALLLGDVSASKSQPGDVVEARLIEPVLSNDDVILPAGSLLEGKVVKKTPPRWGSRAGTLHLAFTGVRLHGGNLIPISASLAGAEMDRRSHTKIDAEGRLRGERPGAAWMAINIGVTAGLAKEVDDTTQLIIETIVASATDASTAGVSRIVSSCVSAVFMVSRHGRDVVLPRFTELDIALDRPLSVTSDAASHDPKAVPAETKFTTRGN